LRNSREPVSCDIFHRAIPPAQQIKFPGLFVLSPLKDIPPRAACPTLFRYYLEQRVRANFLLFLLSTFSIHLLHPATPQETLAL
jgi:hypothetical protein